MNRIIDLINKKQMNPSVPEFRVGDTVKVDVKIDEGKRQRVQSYEGIVIARKGGSVSETFTVRKKSPNGVGINRIFPVNSPLITVTVIKKGRVRRAKLNFLKDVKGGFKIKERN
ncbi:MAG: 50S ribosomal protein L19 [Bacilli bacterium]